MVKAQNQSPRISVNKLCEFMTAKAARQRQILHDQKYPSDFKSIYYKEAAEAVAMSLASNLENLKPVENAINSLSQKTSDKVGTQRRIASNIDALESFLMMLDDIDLKSVKARLGSQSPPHLTSNGVDISVRPDIILTSAGKSEQILVGAMKIHFSATFNLNTDSAGYISAILQEWCKAYLYDEGTTNGPMCGVVDVGSRNVYEGVKATFTRMKDVDAACANIAALWPTI